MNNSGPQLTPETEFKITERHLQIAMEVYLDIISRPISPAVEHEFRLIQQIVDAYNEKLLNLATKAYGLWGRKES